MKNLLLLTIKKIHKLVLMHTNKIIKSNAKI